MEQGTKPTHSHVEPQNTEGIRVEQVSTDAAEVLSLLELNIFPEDPWTPGMILEELQSEFSAYFFAVTGPCEGPLEVLGYGGVKVAADSADIMTIGVLREARGRGIGSLLLRALIDEAVNRGASQLFLEVRESNTDAIRLYERHGFKRIGRRPRYFRNPVEAGIEMALSLDSAAGPEDH